MDKRLPLKKRIGVRAKLLRLFAIQAGTISVAMVIGIYVANELVYGVMMREAINSGRLSGPRLLAAGRDLGATASNVDSPGGLSQIADGPWELRKAVREQRKNHVDVVKTLALMRPCKMFNDILDAAATK